MAVKTKQARDEGGSSGPGGFELPAELLSVVLEVRAELADRQAHIVSRFGRLDQHLARMERNWAVAPNLRAVRSADPSSTDHNETPSRRIIRVPARQPHFDDLPVDLLAPVAAALPEDDELAAALSCRKLRAAVALRRLSEGRSGGRPMVISAFTSHFKLVWSVSCGLPLSARLCELAAERGQLLQLSWLRSRGCPWDEGTGTKVANGGHLSVLQWARANGCPWDEATCSRAAEDGHLAVLQWARANGCPWDRDSVLQRAHFADLAEMIAWIEAQPH